jgi:hypothetical protein
MTQPPPDKRRKPTQGGNRGNIVALVFVVALALGAYWLFHSLQSHNETLNCVASGRRDCGGDLLHPDAPPS